MKRQLTLPTVQLMSSLMMLTGCYLSHEAEHVANPPEVVPEVVPELDCRTVLDCPEASSRCLRVSCEDNRCRETPIPLTELTVTDRERPVVDMVRFGDEALAYNGTNETERFGLDGFRGPGPDVSGIGGRAFHSKIVSMDGQVALVSVNSQLTLAMGSETPTAVEPGGSFVGAYWTGEKMIARTSSCNIAWADQTGWLSPRTRAAEGGCPTGSVRRATSVSAYPPNDAPVSVDSDGLGVRFLSLTNEREVIELHSRVNADVVRSAGRLPEGGLTYAHSFIATEMNGLIAALWVQEEGDRSGAEVVAAMLDQDFVPVSLPVRTPTTGLSYSLSMDVVACEGRFVGLFYDIHGGHVIQLDSEGRQLGNLVSYGSDLNAGWTSAVCLDGGVVLGDWDRVATLSCR